MPVTRNTLEGAGSPVAELETRTDDEVLYGARDEHLPWSGQGADARPDVHADTGYVAVAPTDDRDRGPADPTQRVPACDGSVP